MANFGTVETPMLNGRAYDWASVRMQLLGITIMGVTAIAYDDKQNKVNNFGAGSLPVSRGYGQKEANASITVEMKELERIMAAAKAKGQTLQDIGPFTITVAYRNESNLVITHKLLNVEFTNNKRDMKAGDTSVMVELELIISHIQW
jgi:hypothetical protein